MVLIQLPDVPLAHAGHAELVHVGEVPVGVDPQLPARVVVVPVGVAHGHEGGGPGGG